MPNIREETSTRSLVNASNTSHLSPIFNVQTMKRSTIRMLESLLVLDILLILLGILYIFLYLVHDDFVLETSSFFLYVHHDDKLWKGGLLLRGFGSLSSLGNCLAVLGIRRSYRWLLLPYLTFLTTLIFFVTTSLLYSCLTAGFDPLPLLFLLALVFPCILVLRIIRLFSVMSQTSAVFLRQADAGPGGSGRCHAVLPVLQEHCAEVSVTVNEEDSQLPPKYEELDLPPQYEQVVLEEAWKLK